jgi:hypothetical protein
MKPVSATCLGLLLAGVVAGVAVAAAKQATLSPENRIEIVRYLSSEYAISRQPLPASKNKKEALSVAGNGQVNQELLRETLAKRGAAIYTGERIQITKIEFERDFILFEINGGGKRGRKWYEGIQVGVAGAPVPTISKEGPPPDPTQEPMRAGFGSWVALRFPEGVPDITAAEVKQLLAGVFDFEARSAATPWIETIPEEFREPVKQRRAVVGMTREIVLAAKGRPEKKVREIKDGVEYEDWIYGHPPFTIFVTFVGDEVVEVKDRTPHSQ